MEGIWDVNRGRIKGRIEERIAKEAGGGLNKGSRRIARRKLNDSSSNLTKPLNIEKPARTEHELQIFNIRLSNIFNIRVSNILRIGSAYFQGRINLKLTKINL